MTSVRYLRLAFITAALSAACTVSSTPAPPLSGPSELGLSLATFANPSTLSQDGASQSQIVVQAYDFNGQPAKNLLIRAEITVNGVPTDYGSLSARTIVTDSNGRATLTYTAPPTLLFASDIDMVSIQLTPASDDALSALPRSVNIRLVPPGVIIAGGPTAAFTFTPASPTAFSDVLFDGSTSTSALGTGIVSFSWTFGDGASASGQVVTHAYAAGNFTVRLTVTDTNGLSSTAIQAITVGAGNVPTAAFTRSPTGTILTGQPVFFNASSSQPGTGRKLVRYDWDFGTGSTGSGVTTSKSYDTAGTYQVTLVVTDDVGQTDDATSTITVTNNTSGVATARYVWSPNPAQTNQPVTFDASASSTTAGTIIRYDWNFGDGSNPITSTTSPTIQHTFTQQAGPGGYTVILTVTDSNGQTGTRSQQVIVQ